jgi:hypothetical protein
MPARECDPTRSSSASLNSADPAYPARRRRIRRLMEAAGIEPAQGSPRADYFPRLHRAGSSGSSSSGKLLPMMASSVVRSGPRRHRTSHLAFESLVGSYLHRIVGPRPRRRLYADRLLVACREVLEESFARPAEEDDVTYEEDSGAFSLRLLWSGSGDRCRVGTGLLLDPALTPHRRVLLGSADLARRRDADGRASTTD